MIEINIQGKDVTELYSNTMNMALLLQAGGNALFKANAPAPAPAAPEAQAVSADTPEAIPEPNPPAVEAPKRRGRPPKLAPVIEATALPAETADDPLGLSDTPLASTQDMTLDDMRDRAKAIIEAHQARGNTVAVSVAYIRKLYAPFNIKLAAELKPEQFAEFMAASDAYLDGSAK